MINQAAQGSDLLLSEDFGPVRVLTLNRGSARNCLSIGLMAALHGGLTEAAQDDAVRAVVLTGAGAVFSSGHDLKELTAHRGDTDRGRTFYANTMAACTDMMLAIVRSPKPVIAAVNGIARRQVASLWRAAISQWPVSMRASPRLGSILGCFAPRPW